MRRPDQRPYDVVKRAIDIIASGAALIVLSPVMLTIGSMVAIRLGRPVIFTQERPGRDEIVFRLHKFRTMRNVDERRGLVTNEQRMTPLGNKLRATSLDELPSLWNVLRGDMSLVGPRPLLVSYLTLYSREQARRHEVRPGLTGLAQVSGRNGLDWNRRFALDVAYIDNRSLWLDIRILCITVVKVFQREGISSQGHAVGAPFTGETEQASDG